MSHDAAHEKLRAQPLSSLGAALACAVINHQRGDAAVEVVCGLINTAQVMAERMSPIDRFIIAHTLHQASLDLLPVPPLNKPKMNGHAVKIE